MLGDFDFPKPNFRSHRKLTWSFMDSSPNQSAAAWSIVHLAGSPTESCTYSCMLFWGQTSMTCGVFILCSFHCVPLAEAAAYYLLSFPSWVEIKSHFMPFDLSCSCFLAVLCLRNSFPARISVPRVPLSSSCRRSFPLMSLHLSHANNLLLPDWGIKNILCLWTGLTSDLRCSTAHSCWVS